jgi:hypothetical protein
MLFPSSLDGQTTFAGHSQMPCTLTLIRQILKEKLPGYLARKRHEKFFQLKFPSHIWGEDFAQVEKFRLKDCTMSIYDQC